MACHSLLLLSDGTVAAYGDNGNGQCNIPALEEGLTYTQVATGRIHSLLLKSNGTVTACGNNRYGQCDIPVLNEGLIYTQVATNHTHSLLLKSDGTVLACGNNRYGQCDIPMLKNGLTYTQVAAGGSHSLMLKSDGTVAACGSSKVGYCRDGAFAEYGDNGNGQCNIPALEEDLTYTQVAAGSLHSLLLKSNGTAVACGSFEWGQCNIPALEDGLTYTQISAGGSHSLMLKSDGTVAACGCDWYKECTIPALKKGLKYTRVDGGDVHSILLKSDGTVAAFGHNKYGQCNIPEAAEFSSLANPINPVLPLPAIALTLNCNLSSYEDGVLMLFFTSLGGETLEVGGLDPNSTVWKLFDELALRMRAISSQVVVCLESGENFRKSKDNATSCLSEIGLLTGLRVPEAVECRSVANPTFPVLPLPDISLTLNFYLSSYEDGVLILSFTSLEGETLEVGGFDPTCTVGKLFDELAIKMRATPSQVAVGVGSGENFRYIRKCEDNATICLSEIGLLTGLRGTPGSSMQHEQTSCCRFC